MKREKCTAYACTRLAAKGFKRCDPCRAEINAKLRARVALRRRLKLCKCGNRRAPGRKTCQTCLDYFSARIAVIGENRRLDGLCPKCGRVPDKNRTLCSKCLAQGRGQWASQPLAVRRAIVRRRKRYSRNEDPRNVRIRIAACKARWRAAGRCVSCGKPCEINPHRGQPYAQCLEHRRKAAVAKRARLRKKKRRRIVYRAT